LDQLKRRQFSEGSILLQSKSPSFENGSHKLNFSGRVTAASVKNFQVVRPRDSQRVVCQFGKIGDDRFHLDYRSPLSAIQAFALALAQFNY
jgi:tubby-related protein 1